MCGIVDEIKIAMINSPAKINNRNSEPLLGDSL
jgi:hypothetical protein